VCVGGGGGGLCGGGPFMHLCRLILSISLLQTVLVAVPTSLKFLALNGWLVLNRLLLVRGGYWLPTHPGWKFIVK
jgi:hypothetical protein